jgi:hypothetical protein
MTDDVTLEFIAKQIERVLAEQAAMRNELRRLSENQMMTARSIQGLRDDLELMIRTEIGGLFAHLETRLERRIDAVLAKVP